MSRKNPYYHIIDDEDESITRSKFQRAQRKEVVASKRFIGSGEDADIYHSLKDFNASQAHQESCTR